jgi:hypothetical protein
MVLLTAAHFHYAGFALPVIAGVLFREMKSGVLPAVGAAAAIAGPPLVAAGITASQLGAAPVFERIAGVTMALTGALVALLHLRLSGNRRYPPIVRLIWSVAGVVFIVGMALGAVYALRGALPAGIFAPDLSFMTAYHGSMNALGFTLPALLCWDYARRGAGRSE